MADTLSLILLRRESRDSSIRKLVSICALGSSMVNLVPSVFGLVPGCLLIRLGLRCILGFVVHTLVYFYR